MSAENRNTIRLGGLVLAGLSLFIGTLYIIGKNERLFGSGYVLKARFRNVGGLMKGNNVLFGGIQAGSVKDIRILDDTTIEVELMLDKGYKQFIRKNALVSIGTEGLIGNKQVTIEPGKSESDMAQQGDLLSVQAPVSTDQLMQKLGQTGDNIANISEALKTTVSKINNSQGLWHLLGDSGIPQDLRVTSQNIRLAGANIRQMTMELDQLVSNIQHGQGVAGTLLADSESANQLKNMLSNLNTTSSHAVSAVNQAEELIANLKQQTSNGQGPVNALLTDSSMSNRLHASLTNIQNGTAAFSQDMEALKHNFLFRGYFRKLEKQQQKKKKDSISITTTQKQ